MNINKYTKNQIIFSDIENISKNDLENDNFFNINTKNFSFDFCFFKPQELSKNSNLFIFLDHGGKTYDKNKTNITFFPRWSWFLGTNNYVMSIADPMYKLHPKITEGWFYGTKENSILTELASLIKKISDFYGINSKQICFMGSSAGGYASIFLANIFQGSCCFASNPQIILKNWASYKAFKDIVKIDLAENDKLKRNDISYVAENTSSKFFVMCIRSSNIDYNLQVKALYEKIFNTENSEKIIYNKNWCFLMIDNYYQITHINVINRSNTLKIMNRMIEVEQLDNRSFIELINIIEEDTLKEFHFID